MNNSFNYQINKVLKNAEKEMLELHHPYVGTEHLLLSLLKQDSISNITSKYNLDYQTFKKELINIVGMSSKESEVILYTPLLRLVLSNAMDISKRENKEIDSLILFKSLLSSDDGIALRILMSLNIDIDCILEELENNKSNVLLTIGNDLSNHENNILIGREKEINQIYEILLRKNKNNPILIGEAGVGKSAIVYEIARRIKNKMVPNKLKDMQIISLDMASLLANTKYRGEFETRLNDIINEVKSKKNIILFIDEVHTIVKSGGGEGSIDAGNILKPYLASDEIKIIGATTTSEYDLYISKDKALSRRFSSVLVTEPNEEETIHILKGVKSVYENYHNIKVSDEVIEKIVKMSNKYIFNINNPDRSLEVMDSLLSYMNIKRYSSFTNKSYIDYLKNKEYNKALKERKICEEVKLKKITDEDIIKVIENISKSKVLNDKIYNNLIKALDKKIYGQNLDELKHILKKRFINDSTLGILIKGENGIGKSYTAKVIAEEMGYNFLNLNMMEYSSSTSINRLIGADAGYIGYDDECLLNKIKYNPYSLILLKNIEYASSNVINLFKSIINNGYVKNSKGEYINFKNTMIIMTSSLINNKVGYNSTSNDELIDNVVSYDLIDKNCLKEYFKINDIKEEVIRQIKPKTTFKEISKAVNEYIYNNSPHMV